MNRIFDPLHLPHLHPIPDKTVTLRTYLYLGIVGIRNLLMGALLLCFPSMFVSSSFEIAFDHPSKVFWGVAMMAIAFGLLVGVLGRWFATVRVFVVLSGVIMALFAGSAIAHELINPDNIINLWTPIVFLAICLKDFIIVSLPYTSYGSPNCDLYNCPFILPIPSEIVKRAHTQVKTDEG